MGEPAEFLGTILPSVIMACTSSTVRKPPLPAESGPWQSLQYVFRAERASVVASAHAVGGSLVESPSPVWVSPSPLLLLFGLSPSPTAVPGFNVEGPSGP